MKIIGRVETATFSDWNIEDLPIKIDTGAYTCAIHCKHIIEENNELKFILLCPDTEKYNNLLISAKEYKKKLIKSSNGESQERYIVRTKMIFFGKEYVVDLSLTNRTEMTYPVLIGRKFLNKKFLVDVSKKNLSSITLNNNESKS